MAIIKLCDWTKKRIPSDEETTIVTIGKAEFEVGLEGMEMLIGQLEGENAPDAPKIEYREKVVYREAPPDSLQAAAPGLDIADGGFDAGPTSMPSPPQAIVGDETLEDPVPVQDAVDIIPDTPTQKLRMPSKAQADQVVAESTRFAEGGLASLTVGNPAQRQANRQLKAIQAEENAKAERKTGGEFNVGFNNNRGN